MNCIVGYTGFVGSTLDKLYHFDFKFNTKNIHDIKNHTYDKIFFCGLPATKWQINQSPDIDWDNITKLQDILKDVKCNEFILISTIDVYNVSDSQQTEDDVPTTDNHFYGKHRRLFEIFVQDNFNCRILRLPGLFGYGLKKNLIYDIINMKEISINRESYFQYYNIDWIKNDIDFMVNRDIKILNAFPEPISVADILRLSHQYNPSITHGNLVRYDLKTRYTHSGYWKTKHEILISLQRYFILMIDNHLCMSNLCSDENIFPILAKYRINNMEIAPFKTFGKDFINNELTYFEKWIDKVYSMQSLLYPHTEKICDNIEFYTWYMKKLIDIASHIKCKILVFGSPKARSVKNDGDVKTLIAFFKLIGDYAFDRNVMICIEPNSSKYECNFIVNSTEARYYISQIDSRGIRLHLDTACMELENEDVINIIRDNVDILQHIHLSAPYLYPLNTYSKLNYAYIYNEILKINYSGYISIEMNNTTMDNIDRSIYKILKTPSVCIIGAGWYGCHIGTTFKNNGYNVSIFDKSGIFHGASNNNQNRLHLGFHYPRSFETRKLCYDTHSKFMIDYGFCVENVKNNLYVIPRESNIDATTYKNIYRYDDIPFNDVCDSVIRVDEKFINNNLAKSHFEKTLSNNLYIKNIDICSDELTAFDYVFDLTNNENNLIKDVEYELTLSLVYKTTDTNTAYTFMDGDFFSIYPYDMEKSLVTLTSVKFTPLIRTSDISRINNYTLENLDDIIEKFESQVVKYLKNFKLEYTYHSYFLSKKCKLNSNSDTRIPVIYQFKNLTSIFCGKISGIYHQSIQSLTYSILDGYMCINRNTQPSNMINIVKNSYYMIDGQYHYRDAEYYCQNIKHGFSPQLMKCDNKILRYSNSYIDDTCYYSVRYRSMYDIYERLFECAYKLLGNEYKHTNFIQDSSILFANAFSNKNFGHDLSLALHNLDYYIKNELDCCIVLKQEHKKIPRLIEFLSEFIDPSKYIYLENDTHYSFRNIIVLPQYEYILDRYRYSYLLDQYISIVTDKYNEPKYYGRKICMLKNTHNSVLNKENCFDCTLIFELLRKHNWLILNPEDTPLHKIVLYLNQATKIFVSHGCLLYAHEPFFSHDSDKYVVSCRSDTYYDAKYQYNIIETLDVDNDELLRFLNE